MTWYLNFRRGSYGVAAEPYVQEADGRHDPPLVRRTAWALPPHRIRGADILFAVHGFNVSYQGGMRVLARLEAELDLPEMSFVGVLWPGDWWVPFINYPAEAGDAVVCGRRLAAFIDRTLQHARSLSFVSHSLGARVVLETIKDMGRSASEVCLTAPAVDDNCFKLQYLLAGTNAARTTILSSRRDMALKLAYAMGDFAGDITYDTDSPWRAALGYHGPRPSTPERVWPTQIPDPAGYDHSDYFPPSKPTAENAKSEVSVRFMRTALRSERTRWPPA